MNRVETCLHNKLCMGLYGNFTGGEGSLKFLDHMQRYNLVYHKRSN